MGCFYLLNNAGMSIGIQVSVRRKCVYFVFIFEGYVKDGRFYVNRIFWAFILGGYFEDNLLSSGHHGF